jgi:ABC-type nitrate/sulfonate/bicarbonate transport system substrate-binding protein
MWSLLAVLLAAALVTTSPQPARSRPLTPLTVNVFPAGFNWPLWVAQDKGLFARNGVAVKIVDTSNSVQQMTGLIGGHFEIAMTAIDNVIAYMEGQGEAPMPVTPDIVAVMGSSNGFLSLIVTPKVKSFEDLRRQTLSVDAMRTGYAFTLRTMLGKAGLDERDYTLVKVGGMKERYQALIDKQQAGTLLVPPYTLAAADRGFHELGTAVGMLGHYQGGVAAVRREWAAANRDALVGFIRSNIAALGWLYDPANKAEAMQIFRKYLPTATAAVTEKSYGALLNPVTGFPKAAEIDVAGVNTVMKIRSQYAEPHKPLTDASRYYDLSYYHAAVAR